MSVSNISIYTIPAAFLVNMLPHVLRLTTIGLLKWDNTAPRTNLETAAAKGMNKSVHAKLLRATGAHLNGLEMMPLFFSAVIAGNFAGLPAEFLNKSSVAYIVLRLVYNGLYIYGTNAAVAGVRTLVWGALVAVCVSMLKNAGDVLASK